MVSSTDEVQLNPLPKMIKVMSYRTGRYIYKPVEEYPSIQFSQVHARSVESGLHNPIVLASVAAGVIGVVIVIILIFTIWLRRRCYTARNGAQHKIEYSTSELDSTSSSTKSRTSPSTRTSTSISISTSTNANASTHNSPDPMTTSSHAIMTIVDERPRRECSLQNMNEMT